jgi:6-pyruvoyltetrahydropterin/6-carboxytetrahydropterin synthase
MAGRVDAHAGWVIDYARIVEAFEPLRAQLDHHCLNDIAGLENPTSEHLAMWIWDQMWPALPALRSVEVREMLHIGCVYRGPQSIV